MAREPGFRTFSLMAKDGGRPFAALRQAGERIHQAIPGSRMEAEEALGIVILQVPEGAAAEVQALAGDDVRVSASQPLQSGPAKPPPFLAPAPGGGTNKP